MPSTHRGNFKNKWGKRVEQTAAPALPVASQCYDPTPQPRTCSHDLTTQAVYCPSNMLHSDFFLPPLTLPFSIFSLASLSLSSAGETGGAGEALGRRISAGFCKRHFPAAPMLWMSPNHPTNVTIEVFQWDQAVAFTTITQLPIRKQADTQPD